MSYASIQRAAVLILLVFTAVSGSKAETLAPVGCPMFHCNLGATGAMGQAVVQQALTLSTNATLGTLKGQGCSGDGNGVFCLFATDTASGYGKGTLKALHPKTLQPVWGSLYAPNSYNLVATTAATGQVPVIFSSQRIAAGDASFHVLYDASGGMIAKLPLGGAGSNFGLTPISDTHGIVSQNDGVLTLVNLSTWQNVGVLELKIPGSGLPVSLVLPSSGANGVLYAVGVNSKKNVGALFAVAFDAATQSLKLRSWFVFVGTSGASPVVVLPGESGFSKPLVLLHVPALVDDSAPQDRLLGIADNTGSLTTAWAIDLPQRMQVAPAIDTTTQTLFFSYQGGSHVYQHQLATGARLNDFNLQSIGAFPSTFVLNGHLASTQTGGQFTLLLSGAVSASRAGNGQYAMAFAPGVAPTRLVWSKLVSGQADSYTAAWTLVPSSKANVFCPVVVGISSGISRLCDF